ncbi:hypothetical protein [Spiroplasma citri]|uniref:hypothetical protein n=1 Tax=Spiroplasma citri TaxID=2133 RepID=UPI0013902AC0|nr:hypothetical protein [Spiroplasma citri]QJU60970.1 hypothetical protein HHA36_01135 [Spiroplasma citri]
MLEDFALKKLKETEVENIGNIKKGILAQIENHDANLIDKIEISIDDTIATITPKDDAIKKGFKLNS